MSLQELHFCLRDVNGYWSTPRIAPCEVEYLERHKLIQRAPTGICAIRLTETGMIFKRGREAVTDETWKETFPPPSNARRLSN